MNRLRELRKRSKKTLQEVANNIEITPQALSLYELEQRQADYNTLLKLAEYFNVSVDYLLGRTDLPLYIPADLHEELEGCYFVPEDLKGIPIAFFDGIKDLEPEDFAKLNEYIDFIKERKKNNK